MRLISRHIFRRLTGCGGGVLVAVVGIYLIVDFFERVDNFMDAERPVLRTLLYLAYKIPAIIGQILPLSVLMAVLIVFGLMARRHELIALKSSGISVYALVRPVVAFGLAATTVLILFSEVVAPAATARSNHVWQTRDGDSSGAVVSRSRNIWLRESDRILFIRHYHPREGAVHGLTLYEFTPDFKLARRLDARRGRFTEAGWRLEGILEQVRAPEAAGGYRVRTRPETRAALPLTPEDLTRVAKSAEEMNFAELLAHVRDVEDGGYDATAYRVDLHAKIAFPLVCLILGMVGVGMAARTGPRGGMPVSIAHGLGTGFLYWVLHSFNLSLGYGGMLPAPAAAWAANVVFACLGVYLLVGAE
jgi:lipopolysaccharide export system permease protein